MINDSTDAADDQYTGSPRTFLQILIRERVFLALLGVAAGTALARSLA